MANEETVIKVVEGIDKLFSEIVVNGKTVKSSPSARTTQMTPSAPRADPIEGQYVGAVQLNNVLHKLKDVPLNQRVADLESDVDDIKSVVPPEATSINKLADKSYVNDRIRDIADLIPAEASESNKLADKDYVGTEISDAINALDVPLAGGNGKYIKSIRQVDGKIEAVEDDLSATGGGVAFKGTRAQYEQAKLIPLGETGHIPSGSLVIITDENDYVEGEDR